MKAFNEDWISSGLLDFEYKKYILLDYLQYIDRNYQKNRLYPFFSDLLKHYIRLLEFKNKKSSLSSRFPGELLGIDWKNYKLKYGSNTKPDDLLDVLDEIIDFGVNSMKIKLDQGKEIYEGIESELSFFPIGIEPLYKDEGFLLIAADNSKTILAYSYTIRKIMYKHQKVKGLKAKFIRSYHASITNTFENIKLDLMRQFTWLNISATYTALYRTWLPLSATMLPIAKRKLSENLNA